jgi:ribosomal-protein-alanine N-acetyltransferase
MKEMKNRELLLIRSFRLSDLDGVLEIEKKSFTNPWPESEFRYAYRRNSHKFLVAMRREKIVGYVITEVIMCFDPCIFQVRKRGHLLNLAVHPEFRLKGIGKALTESIISNLRKVGVVDVCLEVRASNFLAQKFYLEMGFEEKDRKSRYYPSEDAVIMVKKIFNHSARCK